MATVLVTLLWSAVAHGQAKPANGQAAARTHFKDGVEHAARGELEAALQDFEAAYALQPHYSVLYNIGQAQAALGRPAAAARTFERYLIEGGNRLSQARRDEVAVLREEARKKLGHLRISVASATTRVWLDGTELDSGKLAQPIELTVGQHSLISSDANGPAIARTVSVSAQATTELKVDAPLPQPAPKATIAIVCSLPGVVVEIDGERLATTPVMKPLYVEAGLRTVRLTRPGYQPTTQQLVTSPTDPATVTCNLRRESTLVPKLAGKLLVRTSPADAITLVDGQRFFGGSLPIGEHVLQVERDGFASATKTVSLRAGGPTIHDITLQPTEAYKARQDRAAAQRRTFGYLGLGGGLAFAAGGLGLFAWNGGRYDDWRDDRNDGNQLNRVTSIQRVDDLAIGSMVLGTGLIAVGAWLLLTPPATAE